MLKSNPEPTCETIALACELADVTVLTANAHTEVLASGEFRDRFQQNTRSRPLQRDINAILVVRYKCLIVVEPERLLRKAQFVRQKKKKAVLPFGGSSVRLRRVSLLRLTRAGRCLRFSTEAAPPCIRGHYWSVLKPIYREGSPV